MGHNRKIACLPEESSREHLLLTVIGTKHESTHYRFKGKETESRFAPIALYNLLAQSDRPDRIIAVCTPQAESDSWPSFKSDLGGQCPTTPVPVPTGETHKDIDIYIEKVAEAIPYKSDITVDVTHGFRHLSFLTFVVVLYVSALCNVRVRGAYYGLLRRTEPSPFLDLRGLLELPRWLYALRALNDTGSTQTMADIIGGDFRKQSAKRVTDNLRLLSDAYLSGLPLELGKQAAHIREQHHKPLRKLLSDDHRLPLCDELGRRIDDFLSPFALPTAIGNWKKEVALTEFELKRQARHIDRLFDHGHVATALGLMNEWTVSWALWAQDWVSEWLDYNRARRSAANLLSAIEAVGRDKTLQQCLNKEQRQLGRYWKELRDLRNGYAHHGMRLQILVDDPQTKGSLDRIRQYWNETLRNCPSIELSFGEQPGRRILVSPIGMRPGVLFSALKACKSDWGSRDPDLCLVICSRETAGKIGEATDNAGYQGAVESLCLNNPFGEPAEIKKLAEASRYHFVGAENVVVNITGGTTLMGLVAEAVASTARGLACPVRRFGLIDRRSAAEQESDPWQAGEPFWLDPKADGNADDD